MVLSITLSRRLAVAGGLFLPIGETVRRWRELPGPIETWPPWLDDFVLGAVLLSAAWLSRPQSAARQPDGRDRTRRIRRSSWLTAGWGFVCGAGFGSTLSQLNYVINPALASAGDPSGLSNAAMVLIKATLVAIGLVGLFAGMREEPVRGDADSQRGQ